jgi:hypothetical protein
MMRDIKRSHGLLTFLVGSGVLGLHPNHARAQWGMGYGWGWGGLNFYQPSSPTNFLNQQVLNRAAAIRQPQASHSPYANNPNSYFNRVRDNGFVSHYDVRRRRPPSYQAGPTASLGYAGRREAPAAAAPAAPEPIPPLASFFDAALRLVWPSESPIGGELRGKRDLSDQASLAVLEETRRPSGASIASVTHARQQLLDYGRPALQEIRAQSTPAIADTFHRFLLSLYDSLAQAAWPPDSQTGTAPHR